MSRAVQNTAMLDMFLSHQLPTDLAALAHTRAKPATYLRQGNCARMQVLTHLHTPAANLKSPQLAMQSSLGVMKYPVHA